MNTSKSDKSLEQIHNSFEGLQELILQLRADLAIFKLSMEKHLDILEERTRQLPKLYDAVDAFMGEITASREERVFIGRQLKDYDDRLTALENR